MLTAIRQRFLPNKVLLWKPVDSEVPDIAQVAKYAAGFTACQGKSTAYVCTNFQCSRPTTGIDTLLQSLQRTKG